MSKSKNQEFSKEAFVSGAEGSDGLLMQVLLEDGKSYTKEQVAEILQTWKAKVIK